jgi:hypothetical protein
MKKTVGLVLALSLFTFGCAHHRDVRAGADGIHRVVIQTDDTDAAARDAISQANNFCEERNKQAAFINEDKKYTGDMDESTYKTGKRASKAAQAVGGAVWVFGGKTESDIGGITGLGGAVADSALGKGYTVEMKFKCM